MRTPVTGASRSNVTGASRSNSTISDASASNKSNKRHASFTVSFAIALIIVALGGTQLISTAHAYFSDLSQLNSLKTQESSLKKQDSDLKNDIARWDDTSYVVAQARENLGFVFPGETAIMVVNPQVVEGSSSAQKESSNAMSSLPWYSEMTYSFGQADKGLGTNSTGK